MAILPVRGIPALETMPISTCPSPTRGQALVMSGDGYLTNSLTNYATSRSIYGVCAETKATAASLATSNTVKVWPINCQETLWEAAASGTAAQAGVGSVCNLKNNHQGVIYSATTVTTGGSFLIESIESTSLVRGRFVGGLWAGRRTPNIGGTT